MPPPKAAIFDIDGTLVDSVDLHAHAWQDAFRESGKEIGFESIRSQIGKGGDNLMPEFLSAAELEKLGKKIEKARGEIFKEHYLARVQPFPRVRELFERLLADGWRLALATSGVADEVAHHKELCGITDLVDVETTKDDASRSKPHPDIFAAALEKLSGVTPADALTIGDTPYDAEAAGKLGIRTAGVLCGGFPEDDLRAAGAVAIFRDPADLLARYEEFSALARNGA